MLKSSLKDKNPFQMRGRFWQPARRDGRGEAGSALVEAAVTASIMLTLVIGLFELGMACCEYHFVSDAAREGTRYAVVRGSASCTNEAEHLTDCDATTTQIQNYVSGLGYVSIAASEVSVSWLNASSSTPTTWSNCATGTCNAPGNMVKVVVTHSFPMPFPFRSSNSLSLSSTSEMVISQ
jgi:Flp pilus assembly protein TadG